MMLLRVQHPNVYACVLLNDGPQRYDEDDNDITENGLEFKELYHCKALLSDTAKIINIKITHLSLLPPRCCPCWIDEEFKGLW
jgi:hypothetical protein